MSISPATLAALGTLHVDTLRRADPLDSYRCATWAQVELCRALALDHPPEVLWHSGNKGAKTTGGLATTLAFVQGRDRLLDWDRSEIRLPVIKPPVSWVLGLPSYKIGGPSCIEKLRELLGNWPYHEAHAGGPDSVNTFTIRHRLSTAGEDTRRDWSRLYVFPYEGVVPEAMRLDGWQCDEPPPYRFLDALRNRGKAGRRMRGFLTLTPIERRFWQPIFEEYPRHPKQIVDGRLRLQSSLYDNRALSPDDIRDAEEAVRTSPYRLARLYGDPVDISDTCPFDVDELVARRDKCVDGTRCAMDWAQYDNREIPIIRQHERGLIESWGWPEAGDVGIIVADPSSGVRDPDKPDHLQPRNPSGLAMGSVMQDALKLRFNGYVRAHELGVMAKAVANKCPRWLMVHETNGGWGEAFLRGFREHKAITPGEVWFDTDPITGKLAAEPGWNQTATRRGMVLSALQRAIETGGLAIPSRAALDNLLQVRLDENERWDHGDGKGPHGEDVITLGILAHVMARTTVPKKPQRISERPDMARVFAANGHDAPPVERW